MPLAEHPPTSVSIQHRLRPLVYLVEDDPEVTSVVRFMLSDRPVDVQSFANPTEVLQLPTPDGYGCLIVDLRLPEMSGLEMIAGLRQKGWKLPFLVISGYGEVPDAVSAMQLGAVDFIQKPFDRASFLQRVEEILAMDRRRHEEDTQRAHTLEKLARLTARESEVAELVADGMLNKQVAHRLEVSVKTVEAHRSRVMHKLEVDSVAQLVRLMIESRNA